MAHGRSIVLLTALLCLACADSTDTFEPALVGPQPATLAELTGPWRATPLRLDPATRSRIEAFCRRDMEMPPGAVAAVVDARGAGVATVRLSGVNAGSCDALQIEANGQVAGAGAGWSANREDWVVPAAGRIGTLDTAFVLGGDLAVQGWSVTGRVGVGVARVEVVPSGHPIITATLEDGWFAAWWPAARGDRRPELGQTPPFVVRAFDAAGALLEER